MSRNFLELVAKLLRIMALLPSSINRVSRIMSLVPKTSRMSFAPARLDVDPSILDTNLMVVGDTSMGIPSQERLHTRVSQAQLKAQTVERKGMFERVKDLENENSRLRMDMTEIKSMVTELWL